MNDEVKKVFSPRPMSFRCAKKLNSHLVGTKLHSEEQLDHLNDVKYAKM